MLSGRTECVDCAFHFEQIPIVFAGSHWNFASRFLWRSIIGSSTDGRSNHVHNIAIKTSALCNTFNGMFAPIYLKSDLPLSNRNAIILISNALIELINAGMWPSIHLLSFTCTCGAV